MAEQKNFWDTVKRILEPLSSHKGIASASYIRSAFFAVQGNMIAISLKYIIDAMQTNDVSNALTWVIVIACLYLCTDIPSYFFRNIDNRITRFINSYLYQKYLTYFIQGDNNKIETLGTGKTQSILSSGISAWTRVVVGLTQGVRMMVGIMMAFIVMSINLGWKGFLVFIVIFGCSFIFVQFANKKLAYYRRERREITVENDRSIVRIIMSKFEILQNAKLSFENQKIDTFYERIYQLRKRESKQQISTFDLQRMTFSIIRVSMLIYVIMNIANGVYSLGDLALFWMLFNQIYGNIRDLNDYITGLHQESINIHRLRDTFDEMPLIKGYDTGKAFVYHKGDIAINAVTYNYGKGEVLKNLSLQIEGGKKTALVGISGSGKSTIVKLIAGYIYSQKGEISIDEQPLPNEINKKHISLKSYYNHVGYLTQEPNVFDGTIYENLTYALDHEPSQEELESAIQGAQCQFIYEFPDGIQTEIGEKGIKLSGGQRQRLAIAKVMLKNPQIILLDEPTSALDSFSEEEVTKAFNNLFQGRTVVVIAHRLQTVKKADRIIVLDHGKIVEEGNHDSLVKRGGVYAKMLELQSGF